MTTLTLTPDDRRQLLALARQAILAHMTHAATPRLESAVAAARLGAFVSLHVRGDLRGCIGYPQGDQPLGQVIARCAVSAATADLRFAPLALGELTAAQIEISVLGPIEQVKDTNEIVVGRHGLIVAQGYSKGLLLPQVATEHGWDRDTFLGYTCIKAGLKKDAWKSGAEIFRFEAEVFAEEPALA